MKETLPSGRLPGRVSPFLFHILWGHCACACVRTRVLLGLDTSLEVLCFSLCVGVRSIQCLSGLG